MIDQIKNRVSIIDLLGRLGIKVNSSGFIKSIYKDEKTASMKIYPSTNSFYCFATNQGGDLIKFYADYYSIDLKTAIGELKDIAGLSDVETELKPVKKPIEQKYNLLNSEKEIFEERAAVFEYENKLDRATAENYAFNSVLNYRKNIQINIYDSLYSYSNSLGFDDSVYEYLTGKSRGLNKKNIEKFKLFSVTDCSKTIQFLKDNFSRDELLISGLFKNKYFLFTKHRLIIPYIEAGKIVYLRARYFYQNNPKPINTGKYIGLNNWSGTLTSKRFFNIDLLKSLVPFSDLIITEGEFDCILANQKGFDALGIAGVSSFPKDNINLIRNFNLYFLYDSDEAGQKAIFELSKIIDKPFNSIKLKNYKDFTEYCND